MHFNFWLTCDNLMPPWPPEHWSQILMTVTFSLRRGAMTCHDTMQGIVIKSTMWVCFKWGSTWSLELSRDHEPHVSSVYRWSHFDQFAIKCRNHRHHLMAITSWPIRGLYWGHVTCADQSEALEWWWWWWWLGQTNGSCNHNTGCLWPGPHHQEEVRMTL